LYITVVGHAELVPCVRVPAGGEALRKPGVEPWFAERVHHHADEDADQEDEEKVARYYARQGMRRDEESNILDVGDILVRRLLLTGEFRLTWIT
jgi:hypothetical protein